MKKTLIMRLVPVITLVLVSVVAFSSCTTKKYYEYYNEYYEGYLDLDVIYRYVEREHFLWDDVYGRFYFSFPYEYLDGKQLEDLEIAGTVIFGKDENSDFCPMPYVNSYYDGSVHIVETIGFEATYGRVTFFIQTNEKELTYKNLIEEYEFKLSMFYWRQ